MTNTTYTSAYNTNLIAFNVGSNKDSYVINAYFKHDLITNAITVKYTLIRNDFYSERVLNRIYKPDTKFKEELLTATYQECIDVVRSIVREQGMEVNNPDIMFGKLITHELK